MSRKMRTVIRRMAGNARMKTNGKRTDLEIANMNMQTSSSRGKMNNQTGKEQTEKTPTKTYENQFVTGIGKMDSRNRTKCRQKMKLTKSFKRI